MQLDVPERISHQPRVLPYRIPHNAGGNRYLAPTASTRSEPQLRRAQAPAVVSLVAQRQGG